MRALDAVAAAPPWSLETLDELLRHRTVRKAAADLVVHRSTRQERLVHLRRELATTSTTRPVDSARPSRWRCGGCGTRETSRARSRVQRMANSSGTGTGGGSGRAGPARNDWSM